MSVCIGLICRTRIACDFSQSYMGWAETFMWRCSKACPVENAKKLELHRDDRMWRVGISRLEVLSVMYLEMEMAFCCSDV